MSEIGYGYGSEWHLLRHLGYHRHALNARVEEVTGGQVIKWLDIPFNHRKKYLDEEWKGVDFLGSGHPAQTAWPKFWPQTGNVQNWDAVGRLQLEGRTEWLLVEAKAHLGEIKSTCGAKDEGGLRLIRESLDQTKAAMGVSPSCDWLSPYYQFANRLGALHFLAGHDIGAHLLFIYFVGDSNPGGDCPKKVQEWEMPLDSMRRHLGLTGESEIEKRVHKLFLPVCPKEENGDV